MTEHKGLPVKGYTDQTDEKVALVNEFKPTTPKPPKIPSNRNCATSAR